MGADGEPALTAGRRRRDRDAVHITATYIERPGQGSFLDDVVLSALGSEGVGYEPVVAGCPGLLVREGVSVAGDTVEGNICFPVDAEVSQSFSSSNQQIHLLTTEAISRPNSSRE